MIRIGDFSKLAHTSIKTLHHQGVFGLLDQANEKIHPDKFDMEVYTDEFKIDSDDSRFYIYVAVKD